MSVCLSVCLCVEVSAADADCWCSSFLAVPSRKRLIVYSIVSFSFSFTFAIEENFEISRLQQMKVTKNCDHQMNSLIV